MIIKDGECADITTPTGPMRLHLFRPAAAGRYPGILLYSEIRRMAAFLAGQGYLREQIPIAVSELADQYLTRIVTWASSSLNAPSCWLL